MLHSDQTLTCRDCGQPFTFTAGEQDFYTQRGFSAPVRCPSCRASRKANRDASGGGYTSDSGSSYGGGYSSSDSSYGGSSDSYGDRPRRELFSATCSSCGREAKVPFRPTGNKPVYCSDCFTARR